MRKGWTKLGKMCWLRCRSQRQKGRMTWFRLFFSRVLDLPATGLLHFDIPAWPTSLRSPAVVWMHARRI